MAEAISRPLASLLSLCQRAGKLQSGETAVENAVKAKRAVLVIIAENAADNTKKKFLNKAEFYNINVVVYGSKEDLGACIGKPERSVLCVSDDENFASGIAKLINV